jgi:hypothetical protein
MSDRTFKYRQLGRRDPATSAEMYARDAAGNSVPLVTTADGKLIVEGGGGGGTSSEVVVQGTIPGTPPSPGVPGTPDVAKKIIATTAGELKVEPKADSEVVLRGTVPAVPAVPDPADPTAPPLVPGVPAYAVSIKSTAAGEISVIPKDDALVALRGLVPEVPERPDPSDPLAPPLPAEPAYLTDLSATAQGDLSVLARGLVPEVVEVPGAPGQPPLVVGVPAHPTALRATEDGELAVAITAPVSLMAREDGLSPAADVRLVATDEGALHVSLERSITLPVEVQGVVEVKATSLNWWQAWRSDELGPLVVNGLSDSEGWIDVRAFSRLSATGVGDDYIYDRADGFTLQAGTIHTVSTYAELTTAITEATADDVIFLLDGVYQVPSGTLTIGKSLRLIGQSRDGVIIQTPVQTAPGVTHAITVSANGVQIRNLTVYHRQTGHTSTGQESCITISAGTVGTIIDTCKILYAEWGVIARGQFSIRSCDFEYASTASTGNATYRAIGIYGIIADSEIVDVTAKFIATNTPRFIGLGSVTGTTYTGTLTIARCRQVSGYVHQWVEIQTLPGDIGAFDLVMVDNVFQAFGAGIIFSGTGSTDVLRSVTLKNNQMANAPKGMLGFDGARTTPLLVFATGNTATDPTLAAAYDSIYEGFLVAARNTVSSQYVVEGSDEIPEINAPADSGGSILLYADATVALEYRVQREEPFTGQIATSTLSGPHHVFVPALEPQDILGVGFVRFRVTNVNTSPGGYLALFSVAK